MRQFPMKTKLIVLAALMFAGTVFDSLWADTASNSNDLMFTAELRPGVSANIHATVLINSNAPAFGKTVVCLHGLAHTSDTFYPLVDEIFSHPIHGGEVRYAILIDLPGRGGSGLPFGAAGVRFGELTIEDYASVLIETLDELGDNYQGKTIIAHSMGGLITQVAQERLLSAHTSLRSRFGIRKVNFLASSAPAEVPNPFADSGTGLIILNAYTTNNATLGTYVDVDPVTFWTLFFNALPDAPTPCEIDGLGYKSIESYAASVQTVGTAHQRPGVRQRAFASWRGTRLRTITGALDPFGVPLQQIGQHVYLTGDILLSDFAVIPTGVHDEYIRNPAVIVTQLRL
jgi:pimeloyl-ACP methyl ester carboxylesterase